MSLCIPTSQDQTWSRRTVDGVSIAASPGAGLLPAGGVEGESAMRRMIANPTPCGQARREVLWQTGGAFSSLALIDLLGANGFFQPSLHASELTTHVPTKAKHCIFLFMNGAPSQVDTFDPKPELEKYDGQPYQGKQKFGSNNRPVGYLMKSPFQFGQYGESGLEISELFPHTAKHADDLCVLRGMQ